MENGNLGKREEKEGDCARAGDDLLIRYGDDCSCVSFR